MTIERIKELVARMLASSTDKALDIGTAWNLLEEGSNALSAAQPVLEAAEQAVHALNQARDEHAIRHGECGFNITPAPETLRAAMKQAGLL